MNRSLTPLDDDPIAALERELLRAAARQTAHSSQTAHARQTAQAVPTAHSGHGQLRRRLALPATVAAVLLPVLVVAGALSLTRSSSPRASGGAAASRAAAPTLVSELAVLRRRQVPSDRVGQPGPEILHSVEVEQADPNASIIVSLDRHVVVQVPREHPLSLDVTVLGGLRAEPTAQQVLITGVAFIHGRALHFVQAPVTARALAAGGEITALGDRYIAGLLPDGVAAVRSRGASGQTVTAPVRENVTGLQLPAGARILLWLDRHGTIIRRLPLITSVPSDSARTPGRPASPAPPSGDDLVRALGVLRRPQTAADRSLPQLTRRHGFDPALGTPDRGEARLAQTTPWGSRIYLVPFTTPGGSGQILDVFGMGGRQVLNGVAGFSAAQIDTGQAVLSQRVSRPPNALRVVMIVPDRVAQVRVSQPAAGSGPGRMSQLVSVAGVPGNVAALFVSGLTPGTRTTITWLDAHHRPISHFPWVLPGG